MAQKEKWIKMPVKVSLERTEPRLLLNGYDWAPEEDHPVQVCAHGVKLRWQCDWCEEYFEKEGS